MAGFMYFQERPDLIGEATEGSLLKDPDQPNGLGPDDYYRGWIRVTSVSQGITREIQTGTSGTTRSRAGAVIKEVTVEKEVDCASMGLIAACAGGTPFPHVFIHLCTSIVNDRGKASLHPYLEFHLISCKVTSYDIRGSGSDDGSPPTEELALNFDKIRWKYFPIGPTPDKPDFLPNDPQPPLKASWDVLRSSPIFEL